MELFFWYLMGTLFTGFIAHLYIHICLLKFLILEYYVKFVRKYIYFGKILLTWIQLFNTISIDSIITSVQKYLDITPICINLIYISDMICLV